MGADLTFELGLEEDCEKSGRRNSGIGFKKFIAVNLTHNPIRIVHGFTESTEKNLETCPVRKFQCELTTWLAN